MNRLKYILKFLILLVYRSRELWDYLSNGEVDESSPDYMQRNFYLPLLGFMALEIFLCEGFHSPAAGSTFDLQYGMLQMVPKLVAFFVGPYIAMMLLKELLVTWFKVEHPSKDRVNLFVFYNTSFLVALEMLLAFAPAIRFFWFIVLYLLYLTWSGASTYIRVGEHQRWVFSLASALVIYYSSHLLITLLQHMQG